MIDSGFLAPIGRSLHRLTSGRTIVASLTLLGLTALMPHGMAQEVRIVAIVNDEVISAADLDARMRFVRATSGLPDDPEVIKRIEPQVIRQLIDEKLELQEAKRSDVTVDPEDIQQEFAGLEQENNLPPGGLDKFLEQKGISKDTLTDQLRANVAWAQVVRRRWLPFTTAGEEEVTDRIKEIEANSKSPENRIAEIYLPVNDPSDDPQVQDTAQRLVEQVRQGGHFQSIARQFSQAPSAAVGGDLGWVQAGSQPPEVEKIISQMHVGQMGGPFRLTNGYYIFALIDRRAGGGDEDMQVSVNQIVFPMADGADAATREQIIQKAKITTADARSCGEFLKLGKEISPQLSGPLGAVKVGDLPPELRSTVRDAKVAVPTQPVSVHGGIGVFMVCSRQGGQVDRATVQNSIMRQRLNNRAIQYLADLRRTAYIDMRAAS